MASTRNLDWLASYARERGAVVRLLGDPAQLSSVEAGGALGLLAGDTDAIELTQLHRFHDPAEADATLAIRDGRREGLKFCETHDRIRSGARHDLLDQALAAWENDPVRWTRHAADRRQHRRCCRPEHQGPSARVRTGVVEDAGVELADGTVAGVGDRVVTDATTGDSPPATASLRQERRHLDRPRTAPRRRHHVGAR